MPIGVNIAKAKELQKERFRQVRKPLLEALDIDYQRADEAGDASKKTEIATKKQALRDVTNRTHLPRLRFALCGILTFLELDLPSILNFPKKLHIV